MLRPVVVLVFGLVAVRSQEESGRPPNVLLVMTDDQGWGDVGFRGHPRLRTPHLDAMAKAGLVFDRFYAAAPVCSPTRASVLTGRHPMRLGVPGANSGHLPRAETTLAELLRARGYRTGFFGKWHLGTLTTTRKDSNRGGRPQHEKHYTTPADHGFDEWFATEAKVPTFDPMLQPGTKMPYGTAYWNGDESPVSENLEGDDSRVIVDRAAAFVQETAAAGSPFFAVVWLHSPHLPIVADPNFVPDYADVENATLREYYACVSALDAQIGRLRALLTEIDAADNTITWFCSDNGPEGQAGRGPGSAGPLRGRKRHLYEGGVRVPGVVTWPERIAAGSNTAVPCVTSDILPTIAALTGCELPADVELDGRDVAAVLTGDADSRGAAIGFWSRKRCAWTGDRWKIFSPDDGATWQLFDLQNDIGERSDRASAHPERVAELAQAFEAWRASVRAEPRGPR